MDDEQVVPTEDSQESPEQKKNKDTKKYLAALELIQLVVGGKENMKPKRKMSGDQTADIVAELFKEEEVELLKTSKEELKGVLKKHLELESELTKKQKEIDELQGRKRKEFVEAVNKWKQKIEESVVKTEGYAASLKFAFEGTVSDKK